MNDENYLKAIILTIIVEYEHDGGKKRKINK